MTSADCGSSAAADTSRYQTASGGKKEGEEDGVPGAGAGDPAGGGESPELDPQARRSPTESAAGTVLIAG
jgi:hypothetical protein